MMSLEIEMPIVNECETSSIPAVVASMNRKEKRKAAKKDKRKQKRKEEAEKERQEEEAKLNDHEEQRRIQLEEEREKERSESERRLFEERERLFLEELARKRAQEEEEQRRALLEEEEQKLKENQKVGQDTEANGDDEWEYIEEGPPEIIWRGNEIIVKKNKARVKKKGADEQMAKEDPNRPISNPLPPQSEAFADYKNASMVSAQQLMENVAQQTPNFGTEQDKAHCPFHLKTGACRFGSRCSRVHFYPDKSCTLLMKNMYNGPGLAWEQDEGLEYTEEEVDRSYEEFYEDVHTEFLKFGEIVNFKVCRNGSYHLRGNVYVHYKSLDSAILAYHSVNGRYFAGKQVTCEFVGVTRWKIAICGEYMKSKLKMCSRGTACNFIHCFRNPGGDYEWADWDKPPPRSWVRKMAALFGYPNQSAHDRQIEEETPKRNRDCSKRLITDRERYRCRRSQSKEIDDSKRSSRDHYEEDNVRRTKYRQRHMSNDTKRSEILKEIQGEEETGSRNCRSSKKRSYDSDSDRDWLERDKDANVDHSSTTKNARCRQNARLELCNGRETLSRSGKREKSSRRQEVSSGIMDNFEHEKQNCTDRASLSPDEDEYRRRTYDSDSLSDWSDGVSEKCTMQRRRSSRHLNEDSGLSDDYREPETISGDEYHQKESDHAKSKVQRVRRVKDNFSGENTEVGFPDEHQKTEEEHVNSNCFQYGWRSKSRYMGISLCSGEMGSPESEQELPKNPQNHKEEFGSNEQLGPHIAHIDAESKLPDSRGHLNEDIDRRGRWEPENFDSGNEQKHIRKSDSNDRKQRSRESESHCWSSDEYSKKASRSRASSKSSKRTNKHQTHFQEMESGEQLQESSKDHSRHKLRCEKKKNRL